jgi:phosphohistidine swiveling domain-containing protein
VQIEDLYGMPMDIEWALADGALAILQARPITALPEPEAETPAGWELPDPKGHYMRASIVELMPDPLSPLFATMGLDAIGRGIQKMIKGVFGAPPETLPADLLCTINGYAYLAANFTPKQWWLMLTRMVPTFGRVFSRGVTYWRETAHAEYAVAVARWRERRLPDLSPTELLAGVGDVLAAFGHHLGTLMASTMGPSAGSEALFTRVYERLIKREGDPSAPTFLMGFDSMPIRAEKALYDLAIWCRERDTLAAYLSETSAERIVSHLADGALPPGVDAEQWPEWADRFRDHLDRYGYSIYDLDFARPLPMDEPAPTLETLKLFISGPGKDPYERQQAYVERREQAVRSVRERLRGFKRWAFEKMLSWAQGLAPLREDGIVEIGLGYPLLRRMLRELGRRLVEAGAIEERDDIYWLQRDEVEQAAADLERGAPLPNRMAAVRQRRAEWRACKRLTPPPQLPLKAKLLGVVDTDPWLAARAEETQTGDAVEGVGASPGQVTARARVIRGPEEFGQMQPGEVLVASITTPAWTPLFAMAAAVVTDIGGPLSHGSIVAREYGIPAVLGTGVATRRIHSGQTITVDGSAGTVVLAK